MSDQPTGWRGLFRKKAISAGERWAFVPAPHLSVKVLAVRDGLVRFEVRMPVSSFLQCYRRVS